MTDIHGNLLWYGERTAWGRLKKDERFVNQDPIELWGGDNLYWFGPNAAMWLDLWGVAKRSIKNKI